MKLSITLKDCLSYRYIELERYFLRGYEPSYSGFQISFSLVLWGVSRGLLFCQIYHHIFHIRRSHPQWAHRFSLHFVDSRKWEARVRVELRFLSLPCRYRSSTFVSWFNPSQRISRIFIHLTQLSYRIKCYHHYRLWELYQVKVFVPVSKRAWASLLRITFSVRWAVCHSRYVHPLPSDLDDLCDVVPQ